MQKKGITGIFESFLQKESIFENKKILLTSYTPETILYRDDEVKQMAQILAPALKMEKPSNVFIYGKTGTGKTLSIKYTTNKLKEVASAKEIPLSVFYINCKLKRVADTEYRLIAQLAREFGKTIPSTGLPTDEVYRIFYDAVDKKKQIILLVLDEIDQLVKKTGDGILYNLTRINDDLKNAQIAIIGISNDLLFADGLDPRVKSSLSEEEILFPPYNALQLQTILRKRSKLAFKEGILEAGVVEKCAAYAAREHGDARRALDLLRVAGELCERDNQSKIKIFHLDSAEKKIERDRIYDIIKAQPKQVQATLYAIIAVSQKTKKLFTGEIYGIYRGICGQSNLKPLTQRRVSDIIAELDMQGIINANVISKGRYGRTRELSLSIPSESKNKIKKELEESLGV